MHSRAWQLLMPCRSRPLARAPSPSTSLRLLLPSTKLVFTVRWVHSILLFSPFLQVELKDGEEDENVLFDVYAARGRKPSYPDVFHLGDASFTAMTRMETLPSGKSAASDRSNSFKCTSPLHFRAYFDVVITHSAPFSIKSPKKFEFSCGKKLPQSICRHSRLM